MEAYVLGRPVYDAIFTHFYYVDCLCLDVGPDVHLSVEPYSEQSLDLLSLYAISVWHYNACYCYLVRLSPSAEVS